MEKTVYNDAEKIEVGQVGFYPADNGNVAIDFGMEVRSIGLSPSQIDTWVMMLRKAQKQAADMKRAKIVEQAKQIKPRKRKKVAK